MDHILSFLKRKRILPFPTKQIDSTGQQSPRSRFRRTLLVEHLEGRRLLTTVPSISDVVDRSTLEGTATTALAFTVGDAETPAASLTVSGVSSNATLVPNANIVFGGSGESRTVTITPAPGQSGTTTISLTVTDGDLLTATDAFVLTVTPIYQLPAESIPDLTMNADGTLTINFQMGNSAWTPSVTRTNTTLFRTIGTSSTNDLRLQGTGTNRTLRIRPAPGLYGESDVSLTIAGAVGGPTTTTFKVTVNPRAVADNLLGLPGKTSTFDLFQNDTNPQPGTSVAIASFTQPTNGTLVAGSVPGTLLFTPNNGFTGSDHFTYTSQYSSIGVPTTGTGHITVGPYINVDAVHTDIRMDFEAGAWSNEIRTDLAFGTPNQGGVSNPTRLDFDESLLMVNPASLITLPSDLNTTTFNFLGRGPNEPIWVLPQVQKLGVLWPGINTESITIGTIASYTPTGDPRATANARWLRFEMVNYRIPSNAHFSMSQSGVAPVVFWDSMDGVNGPNETVIGNNVSDTFWITENTHAHMNWWFTHPGRYEIDVRSKGFIDQGGGNLVEVTSPINTLHFMVYGRGDLSTTGPLTEAPPTLANDTATAIEDGGAVVINVVANDRSDPDLLERLSVTGVTNGTNGTVAIAPDGQSVSYTPAPEFFGSDSFVYTVTDEHGGIATATVVVNVTAVLDAPIATDVQNGQTQRSFVRNVDLVFGAGEVLTGLLSSGRIEVTKFDLNGENPFLLAASAFLASLNGTRIKLDFGTEGIGGSRNTNMGNGYYRIDIDLNGDSTADSFRYFYRLLGDINGDRQVNATDRSLVMAASGSTNPERDANGDGIVNSVDFSLTSRAINRKLKDGLWVDD
jgi:surface-anchored protein